MLDEARKHGVAVAGVAELAFVVVVDPGEDAFQRAVLLLQRRARLVQGLPDVRGLPPDGAPPCPLRHEELVFVRVRPRDGARQTLGDELLRLLLEAVGQPFQEEQAEDVGLVVAAVDRSAQDVRRRPEVLFEPGDTQHLGGWSRGLGPRAGCRRRPVRVAGRRVAARGCLRPGTGHRRRRGSVHDRRGCRRKPVPFGALRYHGWRRRGRPREARDEVRLLPAGIIEVERSAQRLEAVPRERLQHLLDTGLPGTGQRVDELRLDAAVADPQFVEVETGPQLAAGELGKDGALRRHRRVSLVFVSECLDFRGAHPSGGRSASGNGRGGLAGARNRGRAMVAQPGIAGTKYRLAEESLSFCRRFHG